MDKPKFELAAQDQIERYEDIAREFFADVLDMDLDECLITDESALSDFAFCGMPEELDNTDDPEELGDRWEQWITSELQKRYEVEIDDTSIYLVTLFEKIRQARAPRTVH